jgi:hypothetical protein
VIAAAHERLAAMVGHEGPEVRGRIDARDAARFAVAAGDDDLAGTVPPLMLSSTLEWGAGPPLGDLREDGTGVGREGWLPLEGLRLMGGGQDLEFHDDLGLGEEFTARSVLESAVLKEGGAGAMVLLVIATTFRAAADDRAVLTCRETLIGR